ncbi:MAG: division/cell wall cluster transcriptional repressor MraZ [Desulfovibrio sp.]|jgi:MraZ protein|nr:division/cell wall cluster transcriptional repressor MraZ [Desulfovibrio sp.]
MNFRGSIQRNLDPKGRVMLPPGFREILFSRSPDGSLVLTAYDDCIVAFPKPDWEVFEEKIHSVTGGSETFRAFRRQVAGKAWDVRMDAQGRILLSSELLKYARIENEATLVGQGRRFEIWEPSRLNAHLDRDYSGIAEEIAGRGIDFVF